MDELIFKICIIIPKSSFINHPIDLFVVIIDIVIVAVIKKKAN